MITFESLANRRCYTFEN
jgi:hypothetical protein